MLEVGSSAPDFSLPDENGKMLKLSSLRGRRLVVYFYPKDDTPGCTREACSLRDVYDEILARDAVVIGISKDSAASHARFKKKYGLPFYLLSDPETEVIQAWGAWGEKKFMGRKFMGIIRCTFIVDENFKVSKVFPKVKPEEHGREILEALG